MSSSESDDELSWLYDSDDGNNDAPDMFGYDDYEETLDLDNTDHFLSLLDPFRDGVTLDNTTAPPVDIFSNQTHSAMSFLSSNTLNGSSSRFGDSIHSYVTAPALFRQTTNSLPYYLSIAPTTNETNSNSLASDKVFVGNLPRGITWQQLKQWFIELGYGVKRVDLKDNNPRRPSFAFVRFDSSKTAEHVLYDYGSDDYESDRSKFIFRQTLIRIDRCHAPRQQQPSSPPTQILNSNRLNVVNVPVSTVHYGTLITGAAMKNIQNNSNISDGISHNRDDFGLIAHRLTENEWNFNIHFKIDQQERKFAIVLTKSGITADTEHKFEWNFRDLKGEKISPVLVDDSQIYLLVELKRPPVILRTSQSNSSDYSSESRLPGTPLIGHANAWLFRLPEASNTYNNYIDLFTMLRRCNLSPWRFSERNIIHLIHPIHVAGKRLKHVQLLSNDSWVEKNRPMIDHFLHYRWAKYSFEYKFEFMKLLSKHIITVQDLIVDEQLERIVAKCSTNTFIACTDKIIEFAPRFLHETCDNDAEDWDKEEEQQPQEEEEEDLSNIDASRLDPVPPVDSSNTAKPSLEIDIARLKMITKGQHLGSFSRLLLLALDELRKKHELRQNDQTGIYETKHELHQSNAKPFLIRKVYITPSTVLYEGPYREEKCLVTRHFEQQQDGFLRVTFRDEDYRKLQNSNDSMDQLYDRIKAILKNGIDVCDRHYRFLAFSSSQLREHSCWMFASVNDSVSVDTIRRWMGDFRNIRPVAKMAARLGQSFSTTTKGLELKNREFRTISDVFDKYSRSNCFTDGIGIIAPWLADQLWEKMKSSDNARCPSAFQIRFAGFKGMVCRDVANRISGEDIGIYFRDSMNKFDSENRSIDVVRTSSNPSTAFLNRQIILLLSSLGVPNEIFHSLQQRMLDRVEALTGNSRKACEALREFNEFGGNGYHTFLLSYLKKFGEHKEPFARSILLCFQTFLVQELRTKSKIFLRNSWSLLGVVDETKTLEYGQVFIQIDNGNQQEPNSQKIIQGSVIVTRNPCFHPGDIRRLEAVDIPALHELRNVIVFPMKGFRSHAAEMSGGDLDGDTFWICYDPQLLFETNEHPFDYHDQAVEDEKNAQVAIDKQFEIEDVCDFFGEYIEADNLGIIANSHLAFADQSPLGAKTEKCLQLARMHSTAVDFAKNGVSAPRLTRDLRPTTYPHYMDKADKASYQSRTILGQLYDAVLEQGYESIVSITEDDTIAATSSFPYTTFFVDGYESYVKVAMINKNEYYRELKRLMRQYGIQQEAELVSNYILKFTTKQYAKHAKTFELRNEIGHAYRVIRDKYLRLFWEEFYRSTDVQTEAGQEIKAVNFSEVSKKLTWRSQLDTLDFYKRTHICHEDVAKKASAWFYVSYEWWMRRIKQNKKGKKKDKNRNNNNPQQHAPQQFKGMFSFAWIVYPVLLKTFETNKNKPTKTKKTKSK